MKIIFWIGLALIPLAGIGWFLFQPLTIFTLETQEGSGVPIGEVIGETQGNRFMTLFNPGKYSLTVNGETYADGGRAR